MTEAEVKMFQDRGVEDSEHDVYNWMFEHNGSVRKRVAGCCWEVQICENKRTRVHTALYESVSLCTRPF